jgi:hypothetical protein
VLRDYGVTKVTSAKNDWIYNPDVYVAIVESPDGQITYGGERIHVANGNNPLPIEAAIGVVDVGIYALVAKYAATRTGELCGLWNSKAIAGHGISVLLSKIGVAMAMQLQLGSLFVLCAPYTVAMTQMCGFEIETSIGNNGTFYYPKLDLIATSLMIKDVKNIPTADTDIKKEILSYSSSGRLHTHEKGPKGELDVELNLIF